jgi:hypothetical protein
MKVFLETPELEGKMLKEIRETCSQLGEPGASERAARVVMNELGRGLVSGARPAHSAHI